MVETTIKETGEVYEILVSGEVDASSSINLDNALGTAFSVKGRKVLINLVELAYISSAGLGVFISRLEEIKDMQIDLAFCGLQENVKQVFQLLGLEDLLTIYETREEAIAKLA